MRADLLIKKEILLGKELARIYPEGDWIYIYQINELNNLFMKYFQGGTEALGGESEKEDLLEDVDNFAKTVILETKDPQAPSENKQEEIIEAPKEDEILPTENEKEEVSKTLFYDSGDPVFLKQEGAEDALDENTKIEQYPIEERKLSDEKTIIFERKKEIKNSDAKKRPVKILLIFLVLTVITLLLWNNEPAKEKINFKIEIVRARLPEYKTKKSDPQKSIINYAKAMKVYVDDTPDGYKKAIVLLQESLLYDSSNAKALAILASCYLNLIDSSNKDEKYFQIITKLIEMSQEKSIDLQETVIAEVEFYVVVNRAEAAQRRIVNYTKKHKEYDPVMLYYLAYAFYHRGEYESAAKYINMYPENKAFSAKLFYLKGLIAESLGDEATARQEYEKALRFNKNHLKSHLQIVEILNKEGSLKTAADHLNFILSKPGLIETKKLARAFYLRTRLREIKEEWDQALGDIEKAVKFDKDNKDYILEHYTLRAKLGDSVDKFKTSAKMYYFLSEGEKHLAKGNDEHALNMYLKARQEDMNSYIPPMKIGDMFINLHDIRNALLNYKKAADLAPKNIDIWSKYLAVLIQSYDWSEAEKAMNKFRGLDVSQSAIDKAAADMYAKQGRHTEAQKFYRKAMSRESIDPTVYLAYAESLLATRNYKEAPFFFSLARRYDPLNVRATIGISRAVAEGESIDRAIQMLQDELKKATLFKSELLSEIAKLKMQRGDWGGAQNDIDAAKIENPNNAMPWKLQAEIFIEKVNEDPKKYFEKALQAYGSYSDRNPSDPSGYLERYKIFVKMAKTEGLRPKYDPFEKAAEELNKIYAIYPKYPNLHYFKGSLYAMMGNFKSAVEEFKRELTNNPNTVPALVDLGRSLVELGDAEGALKYLTEAMKRAPRQSEPKHWAGYANYKMRNFQGAIALYQAALQYDKANPVLYKRLGEAYRATGDQVGASRAYGKYLEMEPDAEDREEIRRLL